MNNHLFFIHIPKTAGTSQRSLFFDLYTRKKVFWYGMDTPSSQLDFDATQLKNSSVVGGHKGISFYPDDITGLFCSFVREPIERVASLFNYYAKPNSAMNLVSMNSRKILQESWIEKGLDCNSLVNTINDCEEFRDEIHNAQCRHLSRYEKDFQGVLRTLSDVDAVIGVTNRVDIFNDCLVDLLDCGNMPVRLKNSSKTGSLDLIFCEPGAEELVKSLVQEDINLYEYIIQKHKGLFCNIYDGHSIGRGLKPENIFHDGIISNVLSNINLYSKGYLYIDTEGFGSTAVSLVNKSNYSFGDNADIDGLEIVCRAYDYNGTQILDCRSPVQLNTVLSSWQTLETKIDIKLLSHHIESASYVDIEVSVPSIKLLKPPGLLTSSRAMIFRK